VAPATMPAPIIREAPPIAILRERWYMWWGPWRGWLVQSQYARGPVAVPEFKLRK
jgi:hypothetical protein